ncbi:hypothetical protein [Lentzea kentuckyensis]|uniref:hypothetical protein n=1 Tax=Lentzea kentuckyensis TaxID=360086 RepID=UPI00117A397B|nr:hypothetical protein [Lentzea kentuckyensis]
MATSEPGQPRDPEGTGQSGHDGLRVRNTMDGSAAVVLQAGVVYGDVHIHPAPGRLPAAVLAAYRAQVRDTAPDQLLDRDAELGELVQFCVGDAPYAWWQAGPWAGKSALMAWFVLHPPAGVDVVAFFVTGRLAGQSDSGTFVAAVTEQLAALLHRPTGAATAGAHVGDMLHMLEDAAARAEEAGRRLLLMIDGLDEDRRPAGLSSIAALLPRRPPPAVRVLVTSRPGLQLPDDTRHDHPLRTVRVRELSVSPHASAIERLAGLELDTLLTGPLLQRDLLGLITAAGGGLTVDDLAELTDHPEHEIRRRLEGGFGRSVSGWIGPPVAGYPGAPVYLFSHETLREVATQHIGRRALGVYHQRLAAWADSYQVSGWPAHTPHYLLRGYPQALGGSNDLERLARYATDRARHRRMRMLTGGDLLGLTEIRVAQQVLATQHMPDLVSLAALAAERDSLVQRGTDVPAELAAVWALIGEPVRAEGFAAGVQDWGGRRDALLALVEAQVSQGNDDEAIRFAADLAAHVADVDPMPKVSAFNSLALAMAASDTTRATAAGLIDELVTLAGDVPERYRDDTLAEVTEAIALAGDPVRAELIAGRVRNPKDSANAFIGIVRATVAVGDVERMAQVAREANARIGQLVDPRDRAWPRLRLVTAMAGHGDAEAIASEIDGVYDRARALARTATAIAATDPERARRLVATAQRLVPLADLPGWQVTVLVELVDAQMAGGDHDGASTTSRETELLIGQIAAADQSRADDLLRDLARVWAARGHHDRAETLLRQISDDYDRQRELVSLARTAATAGDHARASRLANEVDSGLEQIEVGHRHVLVLVDALATAGYHQHAARAFSYAEMLVWRKENESGQLIAIGELMAAANTCRAPDQVHRLAAQAELIMDRSRADADLVAALAATVAIAGDRNRAVRLIAAGERSAYDNHYFAADRAQALAELADVATTAGDAALATRLADDAASFVDQISVSRDREEALATISSVVAAGADLGRAETLARRILDRELQLTQLTKLVGQAAHHGDRPLAVRLARELENSIHQSAAPQLRARALAALANEVAAIGDSAWTTWIADSAASCATQIDDVQRRAATLGDLARSAAVSGDQLRALQLAHQAESLNAQHSSRTDSAALVETYALAGNFDRAEALARRLTNPLSGTLLKAHTLLQIAKIAARTHNDYARVRALADEVMSLAHHSAIVWPYGVVFADLITLLAAVGDQNMATRITDEAELLLRRDANAGDQMRSLAKLAKPIALTGDAERCVRLADLVEELSRQNDMLIYQAEAMADLIEALTVIHQHDRVTRLIDETVHAVEHADHPEFQVAAYASLARAVSAINRPATASDLITRALNFIDQMSYPEERDHALTKLASANATLGRFDLAAHQAELITELPARAQALALVARHQHAAGDPRAARISDHCEAVLARIDAPAERARALLTVAGTLEPHDPRRAAEMVATAETLVASTTADVNLVNALANTLAALATSTHAPPGLPTNRAQLIPRARRHLATALTTTAWWESLKGLAQVDPLAIATIADEQLARWPAAES